MHWVCSNQNCQEVHNNDEYFCNVCGTVRRNRLHLKTPGRDWSTGGTFKIDRSVYKMLFLMEYQYLEKIPGLHPYEVYKKPDGSWYLMFNPNSNVDIAIDNKLCNPNDKSPLSSVMEIRLVNKDNSNVKLAPVRVEIEFI